MRRLLAALFVACLALPAAAQKKIQDAPLRIMPVGDSITEGGDGAGGFRRPLFDLITNAYGMPNFVGGRNMRQTDPADFVDPDEDGWSGYRIDQIANGHAFFDAPSIEQRLHDWDPAVVTIHAGTNDAQQDYYFNGSRPDKVLPVIDRLDDLVSRIVAYNPDIYIIVAQIIPANAPASQTTMNYIVKLNKLIPGMVAKHQARGERVSMVDMYTPMLPYPNPDGIHPGTPGYAVMANVWFAGLQAIGVVPTNPDPGRFFAGLHQVDRFSTTTSKPWGLVRENLVRAGSPSLAGVVTTDYKGKHPSDGLDDGSLDGTVDDRDHTWTTTFTLDTTRSPNGYHVDTIYTDAGLEIDSNGDERANQAYEVWWSSVDAPDTLVQLGTFHHIMVNRAERASQVQVMRADRNFMLTRVAKIEFRFTQAPKRSFGFFGIDAPTPYREIEVEGAPMAP